MTRTVRLDGKALGLAREMLTTMNSANERLVALSNEANAIRGAALQRMEALTQSIKRELRVDEGDHCHVDLEYLAEHGVAFAKVGCDSTSLAELFELGTDENAGGKLN